VDINMLTSSSWRDLVPPPFADLSHGVFFSVSVIAG
jgi:hypothetical protein